MTTPPYDAGDGVPLTGDGVTAGIVRIGDTVRRPVRPFTRTVHAYLRHLHDAGFAAAPVPLGIDAEGREVLSYLPGDVPREPLPPACAAAEVLVALARLVRRLHDAAEGWTPPADAVWGRLPGVPVPLPASPELVGHADYCPGNVVFRLGLPAALIDFDLARPTTRVADVANALRWWVPLQAPEDRPEAFRGLDAGERVKLFADAYGLDGRRREALAPFLVVRARGSLAWAATAAEADPVFLGFWGGSWRESMPRALSWLEDEAPAIDRALRR